MAYLIDGLNLVYKFPELELMMYENRLNDARKGLVTVLTAYYNIVKKPILVFFDGKRNRSDSTYREKIGPIEIFYSHDYSADHLIKEYVKRELNPRMHTVVTSDREILFYVNRFRVTSVKSEDFAKEVIGKIKESEHIPLPEKEAEPEISRDEIHYWEEMFKGNSNS